MQKLSVVIPAYNEEARIAKTLEDIHSYLVKNYAEFEIIVVDDASSDKTCDIVNNFMNKSDKIRLLKNGKNRGKGYSVKKGVEISEGDIVVISDADQSVPIGELPKFVKSAEEGYDIAIASRTLSDSVIVKRQSLWRETMGKIFNLFVRMFAIPEMKDTQCGFKCFKGNIAKKLFSKQKIERFAFDVEILYLAKKEGYSISQIPVRWINSPKSTVNPFFDSIIMLKDLFSIKRLHKND